MHQLDRNIHKLYKLMDYIEKKLANVPTMPEPTTSGPEEDSFEEEMDDAEIALRIARDNLLSSIEDIRLKGVFNLNLHSLDECIRYVQYAYDDMQKDALKCNLCIDSIHKS